MQATTQKVGGLITVLMEIWTLLQAYGPVASKVAAFVSASDWPGLIAYLESLLQPAPTPAPFPRPRAADLQPLIDRLKAATA